MTCHLIIPDSHAHPDYNNDRAEWLSKLIVDVAPDTVVHIGDSADMPSLASYDKGKRSFQGRSYKKDIEAHLDFQERLWLPIRKRKKKLPRRIFLEGNHEHRIHRAIDLQPELDGAISMRDLELENYYDNVVYYEGETPGVIDVDGISYAHYFISGILGRPMGSQHMGYTMVAKNLKSSTSGHSHLLDYAVRADANGKFLMGLNCGVYQDYDSPWAGHANRLWSRGVAIKHNVGDGTYDLEWVSIDRLKKEYSNVT